MKELVIMFAILFLINGYKYQEESILNENEVDIIIDQENTEDSFGYLLELSENDIKGDIFSLDDIQFIRIYHLSEDECKNFVFEKNVINDKHIEITVDFEFEYIYWRWTFLRRV